jgi:hypothetical protein
MEDLADVIKGDRYDIVLCAGVLMYLDEAKATKLVRVMLEHTGLMAAFAGLADPNVDNAELQASSVRKEDLTFIHNIDAMVAAAGGRVIQRRWDGPRMVDGNTIYFVFAEPQTRHRLRADRSRRLLASDPQH